MTGAIAPPMRLGDFHIWLVGSADLTERFSAVCKVEALRRGQLPPGSVAHCLLLDSRSLQPSNRSDIETLLGACRKAGVPRLLWIRESPLNPALLSLASAIDRAFTVDVTQLPLLLEAGFHAPSVMHEAAASAPDAEVPVGTPGRDADVVWVGEWQDNWPIAWRRRLREVLLAAAPHGLRIHGVADPSALPEELRRHVAEGDRRSPGEIFACAKVAIAIDPLSPVESVAPTQLFDAIACGAAVVSPHFRGVVTAGFWSFFTTALEPLVLQPRGAAAAIETLLSDIERRQELVGCCRRFIRNNHTYAHRVATFASAAGCQVVPE